MNDAVAKLSRLIAQQRTTCGPPITEIEITRADLEEIKRTHGYVTEDGPITVALGVAVKIVDESQDPPRPTPTGTQRTTSPNGHPMTDDQPSATGGFIQFDDGPSIPITNCTFTMAKAPAPPEGTQAELPSDFSATIPLLPETAAGIMRAIGRPDLADRINIAAHPDLTELNAQIDGFYGPSE